MSLRRTAALALLLGPASAWAGAPDLGGEYDSPLGRVRLEGDGTTFRGILVAPSRACPFRAGDEVLRATLLDDSLAGQVRVCLSGRSCRAREAWGTAVLLASDAALSGAVHVAAKACKAPLGRKGGIAFRRVDAGAASPAQARAAPAKPARAKARQLMKDGASWLSEGNFEQARRRFQEAIDVDASIPEAYNGVGVTYRMRNELGRALDWYKKALAIDPDFGDAYYNMACVYALQGSKDMALRYLQIAAMNGYATAGGMDEDPDLASLRAEPGYRALVGARM
jgi:Flp pilus assembly protein TadD